MANKRELKKEIRYVCGDIAAECLIAKNFVKGTDKEKLNEVVGKVADLQITALDAASFSFDKLPKDFENGKAYHKARYEYFRKGYTALRQKFYAKVNELVKEMNAALPQEVKDNNKK